MIDRMIDRAGIRSVLDCRDVVSSELGKPKLTSAKYISYKCPFHRENKGVSFVVYADGWKCFGACNTSGDVINWVERRQGLSWQMACDWLVNAYHLEPAFIGQHRPTPRRPAQVSRPQQQTEEYTACEPPPVGWQEYALRLVDMAEALLWSSSGVKALHYLKSQRGFTQSMIRRARLGYIPAETASDYQYGRVLAGLEAWRLDGKQVRSHCGIVIPHIALGQLWAVRIRRPGGIDGPKYMGIRGGQVALYGVDDIYDRMPILIVEGEFDSIVANYCTPDLCAVALASASNKHIDLRWLPKMMTAPRVFVRMDGDVAGLAATGALADLSGRVRAVQVPSPHKDINDFYLTEGHEAVTRWIENMVGYEERMYETL